MYDPAFHTVLIDSRIEDLRRASQKSTQPGPGRVDRDLRATRRRHGSGAQRGAGGHDHPDRDRDLPERESRRSALAEGRYGSYIA